MGHPNRFYIRIFTTSIIRKCLARNPNKHILDFTVRAVRDGANDRVRTCDHTIISRGLYQLSYACIYGAFDLPTQAPSAGKSKFILYPTYLKGILLLSVNKPYPFNLYTVHGVRLALCPLSEKALALFQTSLRQAYYFQSLTYSGPLIVSIDLCRPSPYQLFNLRSYSTSEETRSEH